jgi:hypothetical protein
MIKMIRWWRWALGLALLAIVGWLANGPGVNSVREPAALVFALAGLGALGLIGLQWQARRPPPFAF